MTAMPPTPHDPDEAALMRELEEILRRAVPEPRPGWQGSVRRNLISTAQRMHLTPRPERLTQLITLYALIGFILLLLVLLGLIGAGPLTPG